MPQDKPFLDGLAPDDRRAIEAALQRRAYARNQEIIGYLETDRDFCVMIEGRARAAIYSPEGRVVEYKEFTPGDIFGEIAAIDAQPRSARVEARDDSVVGRMPAATFRRLVDTRPAVAWALLEHLALQLRRTTERMFEHSTLVVRDRLVRELVRLAEAAGGDDGAEIRPAPTHFDLAARIGTHREAVSREMSALARQGLVAKESGALVVADLDALRAADESDA